MRITEFITEASGGKNAILYHGTTSKFLPSIKKHGLNPNIETKSWGTGDEGGDSYGGVYLTADKWTAKMAAESAAAKHGGEPVILKVQYRLGSGSLDEDEIVDTIIGNAKYAVIHNDYGSLLRDILSSISGKPTKVTATHITKLLQYLFSKFKAVKNLRDNWQIDDKLKADPQVREMIKKIMESVRITDMSKSTNVRVTRTIGFKGGTRILGLEPLEDEELTEAIDMLPMRTALNTVIPDSLLEATIKMKELYEDGSLNYIKTNAMGWWPDDYKNQMANAMASNYASRFSALLQSKLNKIATDTTGDPIRVRFANIDSPGEVSGNVLSMSNDFIRQVYAAALKDIKSSIDDQASDDDAFFGVLEVMTTPDFALDVRYGLSTKFMNLTSIFMHEMVHIIQNKRQGYRPDSEYRSYLSNPKKKVNGRPEFTDVAIKRFDPSFDELPPLQRQELNNRYFKLYHASPQEIAAFAHNIAELIINDHFLDYVEDEKDMPTMSQLSKDIAYEVTRKIGKPQTQKDVMVWKRYAKIVGQLILTFLKTKQKPSA